MSPATFRGFEPGPLRELLEDVAGALRRPVEELAPGDRLDDGAGSLSRLEQRLAARGRAADLARLRTVRDLAGALVPLREKSPGHHR